MVENFKQALKEVFVLEKDSKSNSHNYSNKEKSKITAIEKKDKEHKENNEQKVQNNQQIKKNTVNQVGFTNKEDENTKETVQTTIISKDTKIMGNITTESNLVLAGHVEGDIECKKNITVSGTVYGNISCDSAEIESATIEGNIGVSKMLQIKTDSRITGNLSGNDIEVSGYVKGDISAAQSVKLNSNAFTIGDISSASISIELGAVVQGSINIKRAEKEQAVAKA